ncbi:MAG: antitoxin [Deltaproteobacteria bacterium]|nr:antitoxin [Deltaproteobacteria bacterium]
MLEEEERESLRQQARREGLSLSAWIRQAAVDRLSSRQAEKRLSTADDLEAFFEACDARETGREPDWSEHLAVIERSRRSRDGDP